MQLASLSELKRELSTYSQEDLIKTCLRLAKHKKEVKELLHYLCFEAQDQDSYINLVKEELEEGFKELRYMSFYHGKGRLRKIRREMNKYIKFAGEKQTEAEIRIYFCQQMLEAGMDLPRSTVLMNLYRGQVKLIEKAIDKLHPDLQFDYEGDYEELVSAVDM